MLPKTVQSLTLLIDLSPLIYSLYDTDFLNNMIGDPVYFNLKSEKFQYVKLNLIRDNEIFKRVIHYPNY